MDAAPAQASTTVSLPLYGRRIVVTRAREQSQGLVDRLQALGAEVVECPAITIEPLDDYTEMDSAIARLATYDWVIFTSANGVKAFVDRLAALGGNTGVLCSRRLGAIGPATAAALQKAGCSPEFVPDTYVAEALVEQIGDVAGCRVLLPRADIARKALTVGLRDKGATVDEITAYRTVAGEGAERLAEYLQAGSVYAITFTSSSTVRYTIEGLVNAGLGEKQAIVLLSQANPVCIGPITAATAAECGLGVAAVASEYTTDGLVDALVRLLSAGRAIC